MRLLRLFALLCLLFAAALPVLAQETTGTPRVYASDMTQRGTRVAIALEAAVEVYDMRYPKRAPLRYEMADVQALAFSVDDDYLALGSASGITILNAHSLAVVNQIEQPASALLWMMYDNRLVAGWERQLTVFDSSEQAQSEPYPVIETLLAYESLDPNIETRHHIRGLQTLWESPGRWSVFIVYGYDINYGNHGESFQGVSQYSFSEETLTDVTGGMEDIIRERELAQFTYDEQYALIGNVWIDRDTAQIVPLPIAAPV
jgi:hypothetical protein